MEKSATESTAENADTLRLELKKTMTEILDDGGGVSEDRGETDERRSTLKRDEAIRILNSLRGVESKIPDSSTSSPAASVLQVPKEFKCMLSRAIMSEPVVISSGQTYEKRYIQQWLNYKQTCPKTKEVLSHFLSSPNHVISELITQWCQVNKYDLPKPSEARIGMFSDDIDLLLERISSPSSAEDQTAAANELRRQTKRFDNVPAFFVTEIPESITRLLTPLSALGDDIDSNPGLQKDIITALLYISSLEENKTEVAQHPLVIPLLTKSLKQGIDKTRRNAAEALWELSKLDSNKSIIGNSETLKALVHVIKEDDFSAAINASYAVFNVCFIPEKRDQVVAEGLVPALINRIKERSIVYIYFAVLSLMTTQKGVIEEIEDLGFVDDLFSFLRNTKVQGIGENVVSILLRMCGLNTGDKDRERTRLKLIKEEEDKYSIFTMIAEKGSQRAVTEAEAILQWIKRSGFCVFARSMEESMAESTAATANTLKRELKKLLTEILSNGGSLKVEVSKEFKCILSNKIMIEPVVIASGNTYEKSFFTESLKDAPTCPKSNEVLSHSLCTPNHLLDELITKWCLANGYDRLKPADEVVTELSRDGIESLLQRISSPSSYEDQVQAAKELRCQTNKFPNVRDRFLTLHPGGITTLISPLTELGFSIAYSATLRALGEVIGEGEMVASLVANSVVYQLCQEFGLREMAVAEGVVPALMGKIEAGRYAAEFLSVLVLLTTYEPGVKEMEKSPKFMNHLFGILRKRSCLRSCENAVVIVINMCNLATHLGRLRVVNEEENKHATFTMLTKEGSSESLVKNAQMVLQLLQR
ncbi:unnamed protein product [Eruca vesicaria subsp. sativa]|uniref:RING-type E3 ubiquitin transferase n=1 Tax=Eruca vesicaria subsp. sativa TaxID=29727 RepID=A0ABC8J2E5_ERUVS|nr:unnamed protein product [Eruca vesicaria subsp. sativa]